MARAKRPVGGGGWPPMAAYGPKIRESIGGWSRPLHATISIAGVWSRHTSARSPTCFSEMSPRRRSPSPTAWTAGFWMTVRCRICSQGDASVMPEPNLNTTLKEEGSRIHLGYWVGLEGTKIFEVCFTPPKSPMGTTRGVYA